MRTNIFNGLRKIVKCFAAFTLPLLCVFYLSGCDNDESVNPELINQSFEFLAEEHGFDPDILSEGIDTTAGRPYMYSVLLMRHDTLIFEKYFERTYHDDISDVNHHHLCSVTKSFTSALIGIAIDLGFIESVDNTMMSYFPEYENLIDDNRKYNITIENLLLMQSGFDGDDFRPEVHHPLANAIGQPMILNPGQFGNTFHYSSSNCHILSGILTKATGMSTLEFANQYLFGPLGINVDYWQQDVDGIYIGGYGLMLHPRDMLKFGQLYLHNGMYNGERIIPEEWVSRSTRNLQPYTWDIFPAGVRNTGYGYLWWNGYFNNYWAFFANGYGGQYIIVFPELEIIVVTTADPYTEYDVCISNIGEIADWVKTYVLGALTDSY